MQLFILDPEPEAAATMLCDVHLRKMCLETAQILSSVIVRCGGELLPQMPRAYNINHPVITALDTPFKINWAVRHNEGLQREYGYRFGRRHAYWSLTAVYREKRFTAGAVVEDWSFARNFSGVGIAEPSIIGAYREYYRYKKQLLSRWHYTRREEPPWSGGENEETRR